MVRYSAGLRDRIFVKDYIFMSSAENVDKYIGKNIGRNLSNKYSQKRLDHAEKSATNALKYAKKKQFKNQQKQLGI